jgi:hypothetical protein
MPTPGDSLSLLLGLSIALLVLAWLSRQISLRIQGLVYHATRAEGYPMIILFLLLMPGVFIHEAAHWLTARLVGLKTGKFRVWPKPQGKHIGMGSVSVQRGNLWQDSLVGLAPLLIGSVFIALIGYHVFQADVFSTTLLAGAWNTALAFFWRGLRSGDGALWAYLLFAIANAMMPSASDREPVKPLLLYVGLTALAYLLLGFPLAPFAAVLSWLTPALQILTSSLVFTILLDAIILLALYLIGLFVSQPRPMRSRAP